MIDQVIYGILGALALSLLFLLLDVIADLLKRLQSKRIYLPVSAGGKMLAEPSLTVAVEIKQLLQPFQRFKWAFIAAIVAAILAWQSWQLPGVAKKPAEKEKSKQTFLVSKNVFDTIKNASLTQRPQMFLGFKLVFDFELGNDDEDDLPKEYLSNHILIWVDSIQKEFVQITITDSLEDPPVKRSARLATYQSCLLHHYTDSDRVIVLKEIEPSLHTATFYEDIIKTHR